MYFFNGNFNLSKQVEISKSHWQTKIIIYNFPNVDLLSNWLAVVAVVMFNWI